MNNTSCFQDAMLIIKEILRNHDIVDKTFREDKIAQIYKNMIKNNQKDREFYSLAHEIKSYDFVSKFGKAHLSNDEKHEPGPDITFGDNRIECVCSSEGNILMTGYEQYSIRYCKGRKKIVDYNKTKEFLLPRITQSLYEKKNKIENYINNNIIKPTECPILFLSLGELNVDFHAGNYGINLLEILVGKGNLTLIFDREKEKFIDNYWEENINVKKNNGKELVDIPAKFFNVNNTKISGVLFSTANIYERYNLNNTFLFLNPYAKNQINLDNFSDIICWKINDKNEYIPMKNTNELWDEVKPEIF